MARGARHGEQEATPDDRSGYGSRRDVMHQGGGKAMIEWKRAGAMREVFLVGRWAIKLPKLTSDWRQFLRGLLSNMEEREFSAKGYPEFCPVVFSLPCGWLVVMRRAEPLTDEFLAGFDRLQFIMPDDGRLFPEVEPKDDSFGMLDGRVVIVDYGSP